jgi:hypothetical protein
VTLSILKDQRKNYNEPGSGSRFTVTKFDGSTVSVG